MKKTNKFLSILLATILILSLFPVTLAHASDNTITFSAETDKVDAKAGDIVNVDICMSENSVVAALTLVVNYDNTALKIVDVKSKEAFGYEEFNTAYGENQLAYLTASANPKTVGGTLFTVQFEVLKDGCTEVSLSVNELADIDLNPLSSSTQSAKIHNFVDGACTDCGEKSVKWSFDEATGTLTIYGTGPMEDYDSNNRPWESHKDDIQKVVIENGVTTISNFAFAECSALESVTIPDSVIIIGNYVFTYCESLTNVTIPDSVKAIGQYAFALCDSLTSITIPDSVTSISSGVFCYCTSLTSVTIPESVTLIGYYAFYDCTSLTDVYYSNTEEKWYNISIDSDNNPLLNARIHYNNTGADTHPYLPVITPPTCTDQGYTTYTCACGYSYVDDYVDATGHSHTSEITTPATHTENGVMTYTCHCGDSYTEAINATGDHYYVPTVTEPTCTEAGYTTYNCVCGDTYVDDETPANGHSFSNGNCTVCGEIDPDYYVFSVKEPSRTKIRNKDGIILHTEITGNAPAGSYVEWTSNNNNFNKTVMNDGASLRVIANNKGNTTFTATLYDANGNELATDSVELYSDSGFFQKIGGFFRSLFGATKIYEN